MKKRRKIAVYGLIIGLVIFVFFVFFGGRNSEVVGDIYAERQGTAIIMTGAGARLPQQVALLEELDRRGKLKDVVFISGVSSGALNAVVLNAILTGKMSWSEYNKILFGLSNNDIFTQEEKRLPLNTDPLRHLLEDVVEKRLGYYQIGDLPIMTEISFVRLNKPVMKKTVYRMCSRKINLETDTTLNLVDIMMASSAFPFVFPAVRINTSRTIPDAEYVDGGIGADHVPYEALLDFERTRGIGVKQVYIIIRKSESISGIGEELKAIGLNDKGLFEKNGFSLDNFLKKSILKRLEAYATDAPELVPRTYVWTPDFLKEFLFFDFDSLRVQYDITSEWTKTHDPVPLAEYILPYLINKKTVLK